jgi:hypothetical protein
MNPDPSAVMALMDEAQIVCEKMNHVIEHGILI